MDNVIELAELILKGENEKEQLPEWMSHMFPIDNKSYALYSAARRNNSGSGGYRADGKEGNINYRLDKAI